jgi:site-specific recombinase XerD
MLFFGGVTRGSDFTPLPSANRAKGYLLPEFYSGATGMPGRFGEGLLLRRLHWTLADDLTARTSMWRSKRCGARRRKPPMRAESSIVHATYRTVDDHRPVCFRGGRIMFDELFKLPAVVARYQDGPYADSRELFLKKAREDGYSPSMIRRIAWALLVVSKAVRVDAGYVTSKALRNALFRRGRFKSSAAPLDSACTLQIFLHFGEAWLRSVGAWIPDADRTSTFETELRAFKEYMRVERGLSSTTIGTRDERVRWFFASLPPGVRSLGDVTFDHIDSFMGAAAHRGWTRSSLHALGSSLRSFFRYAAHRGWCSIDLELGIDLPRLYALEDVPRAPSVQEVHRLLDATRSDGDPVKIRDHAVLSLLIYYGLRRGEVERLTLDDLDWVAEKIHVTRPKPRRTQCYPLSPAVGAAILHYLRQARPRCSHRALFLTINAPFRPLSGSSIGAIVRMRLTEQGVKLNRGGAHCLRHACAGQLLSAGFTLKQIADHLGHRSMNTTQVYTKIDLRGLREVAELDVGELL